MFSIPPRIYKVESELSLCAHLPPYSSSPRLARYFNAVLGIAPMDIARYAV